jgi:succinoglycan biosynthesis protein ExoO
MKPKVSVIIPTYNSEQYIAQALESVLTQTDRNLEVIIIDDASHDLTVEIAHSFQDHRVKIFSNKQNRGVSYGRNFGIRQAQGKWIALLDSDDWYAPDRLEKLIALGEAKDADLIADNLLLINDHQTKHWSTLLAECPAVKFDPITLIDAVKFVTSDRLPSINAKRVWSLGYTKPLIRKEFLLKHQLGYDENLRVGEDFSLYLECLRQQAKFYLLAQPYYYYRTRTTSLSTRKPTQYLAESYAITQTFIDRELVSVSTPDDSLTKALEENLAIFQKRLAFYKLLENIQEQKLYTAIAHLFDNPFIVGDLVQKFGMLLFKKLRAVFPTVAPPSVSQSPGYDSIRELAQELE